MTRDAPFELPIEGEDLVLRQIVDSDFDAVFDMARTLQDEGFSVFAPKESSEKFLADCSRAFVGFAKDEACIDPETGRRLRYLLGIADARDPAILKGCIVIDLGREGQPFMPEVGCFVNPKYHRNGYAKRATFLILERYFASAPGCPAIYSLAFPENKASQAALKKVGYLEKGVTSGMAFDGVRPAILFSVTRDNLRAAYEAYRSRPADRNVVGKKRSVGEAPLSL